jgi:endonuclease YncB( thermonuclease family)
MVKIIDGDTLKIGEKKIRLYGIDAPEKAQNCKKIYFSFLIFNFQKDYKCGERSTLALSKKLNNKKVKCILEDNKDKYKRNIGTCYIENQDINRWLVKNGYAVAYTKYSRKYVLDEQYAMENKLGIWRGTFIRPEKWRRIMN